MKLNFDHVQAVIDELDATLYRLEQHEVESDALDGGARHNNPMKAEISRELLRAADLANAISTEIRMEYWRFKGKEDPREQADEATR